MSEPARILEREEYLRVATLAARIDLAPKTIRNKMYLKEFREGYHWFRTPAGPRFRWSRIVEWLESQSITSPLDDIPLARNQRTRAA